MINIEDLVHLSYTGDNKHNPNGNEKQTPFKSFDLHEPNTSETMRL